jgi:hypothetical protein
MKIRKYDENKEATRQCKQQDKAKQTKQTDIKSKANKKTTQNQ